MALRCKSGNPFGQVASRRALVSCCAILLALGASVAAPRSDRVNLFPKLQAGQTLTYRIAYHLDKQANTQSSVKWAQTPAAAAVMVQGLLRLEVLAVQAQGPRSTIHVRTSFQSLNSEDKLPSQPRSQNAPETLIEFTLFPDGHIDQATHRLTDALQLSTIPDGIVGDVQPHPATSKNNLCDSHTLCAAAMARASGRTRP